MSSPMVTSIDVVRHAIEDRIRDLGGNDDTIDEIAMAASYAMWCAALSTDQTH